MSALGSSKVHLRNEKGYSSDKLLCQGKNGTIAAAKYVCATSESYSNRLWRALNRKIHFREE